MHALHAWRIRPCHRHLNIELTIWLVQYLFGDSSRLVCPIEMATAQRTRPRAVVGAPHRTAWQLKSALRHSVSVAPRTIIFLHFFYNYCW